MNTLVDHLKVGRIKARDVDHVESEPVLALDGVSVTYSPAGNGRQPSAHSHGPANPLALDNVSFAIESGRQVAIVGPNGAGKSTLFKLIVGTIKPSHGRVTVFGHEPGQHICIAYVPQRSQIDWSFPVTVADVVMMGRVGHIGLFRWPGRGDWQAVRDSLDHVQVSHLADKQIGELSGGQQQRVFLARALAQGADLLLLDEPFSGLDAPAHEAILDTLASLRNSSVTILLATHDLNLAAERFDQVLLLNRRLFSFGLPAAVLTQENLLRAYSGQMHVVEGSSNLLLADTCCDDEPAA